MMEVWNRFTKGSAARSLAGYAVVCFIVLQIADITFEPFGLPPIAMRLLIGAMLIGLPVVAYTAYLRERAIGAGTRRRGVEIAILCASLLLFGTGAWLAAFQEADNNEGVVAPRLAGSVSLAVLPFIDLSEGGDKAYFSNGVADELIGRLAEAKAMRVLARASSFQFGDAGADLDEMVNRLGVTHLVEGSVRTSGDRVRISASLIDATTKESLWSGRFDRSLADVLDVQEEVARQVARALAVELAPAETGFVVNEDAYDHYLRSLEARSKVDFPGWIAHLEKALEFDPQFVQSRVDLAMAHWGWQFFGTYDYRTGSALTVGNLLEAESLDASGPEYEYMRALVTGHFTRNRQREVDMLVDLAQRHPNYGYTFSQLVWIYNLQGRYDDSLALIRHARRIDPLDLGIALVEFRLLFFFLERRDEAMALMNLSLLQDDALTFRYDRCIVAVVERWGDRSDVCNQFTRSVSFGREVYPLAFEILESFYSDQAVDLADHFEAYNAAGGQQGFGIFLSQVTMRFDSAFEALRIEVNNYNPTLTISLGGNPYLPNGRGQRDALLADPRHRELLTLLGWTGVELPDVSTIIP